MNIKRQTTPSTGGTCLPNGNAHRQEAAIQADLAKARKFLKILAPDGKICFQTIKEGQASTATSKYKYGSIDDLFSWLTEQNQKGAAITFMVNEGDGKGRKAENVTKIRAVFVDLDGAPLGPVENAKLKPHAIVETSQGKYHAYWLVSDVELSDFSPLQKALAKKLGGDSAVCDLPRVMRLPGFYHMKREPFLSEIHDIDPDLPRYTKEQVIQSLGLSITSTEEIKDRGEGDKIPAGQRNKAAYKMALDLIHIGKRGQTLRAMMQTWYPLECAGEPDPGEIESICVWAEKRGNEKRLFVPEILTAKQLSERSIPPVRWIIKDLLPQGLTLLSGREKIGKSWLLLNLGISIATGQQALGCLDCEPVEVLYMALEDNERRMQERIRQVLAGGKSPESLHVTFSWSRLRDRDSTEDYSIDILRGWLDEHPKVGVVMIDVFNMIRPPKMGKEPDYERDYRHLVKLRTLANDRNISIIVCHHNRKATSDNPLDKASGSTGITGAPDAVWIMDKKAGGATLDVRGRDLDEIKMDLSFDRETGHWTWCGNRTGGTLTPNQEQCLKAVADLGHPAREAEIAGITGIKRPSVQTALNALETKGMVVKNQEGYVSQKAA
jgi:hypothetical protein